MAIGVGAPSIQLVRKPTNSTRRRARRYQVAWQHGHFWRVEVPGYSPLEAKVQHEAAGGRQFPEQVVSISSDPMTSGREICKAPLVVPPASPWVVILPPVRVKFIVIDLSVDSMDSQAPDAKGGSANCGSHDGARQQEAASTAFLAQVHVVGGEVDAVQQAVVVNDAEDAQQATCDVAIPAISMREAGVGGEEDVVVHLGGGGQQLQRRVAKVELPPKDFGMHRSLAMALRPAVRAFRAWDADNVSEDKKKGLKRYLPFPRVAWGGVGFD